MMPPPKKYRRTVEIYFVLYLAALLLLLPDEHHNDGSGHSPNLLAALMETTFSIVPEKNYVTARLQRDSAGYTILSIDSLNTIYPVGNVQDVRYEFVIEDRAIGETLRLAADRANTSSVFSIAQTPSGDRATFAWRPLANERHNRTFTVHVTAKAKPVLPPALLADDNLRQQFEAINANGQTAVTARTQFDVVISFVESGQTSVAASTGRVDTVFSLSPSTLPSAATALGGEPVFDVEYKNIDAFAGEQWYNKARLYNLNLSEGVAEKPRVEVATENNGTASIGDIDRVNNAISLKGTAPTAGTMRVQLITRRLSDKAQVRIEFVVRAKAIEKPDVPPVMYPEQSYAFDPNLPLLTNQTLSAVLYDGEKVRYVSEQGAKFSFTPKEDDIGKKLRFERLVGDKKIGEVYTIRVVDYAPPRVLSITDEGNRLIVRTQAFGPKTSLGKRAQLIVQSSANCRSPRELYGDYTYDATAQAHVQVFELTKINPAQQASCTVVATDQRGRTSDPFTLNK